jgi:hypothetical protein
MSGTVILSIRHSEDGRCRDLELPAGVVWETLAPILLQKLGWPAPASEAHVVEHVLENDDVVVRPGHTLASSGAVTGMTFTFRSRVLPERLKRPALADGPVLGNALGDVFPLDAGENLVGRAAPGERLALDLARLDRDQSVSRRHAKLLRGPDGCFVFDMGSVHGTWVNGLRLRKGQAAKLKPGDRVQFGDVSLRFQE